MGSVLVSFADSIEMCGGWVRQGDADSIGPTAPSNFARTKSQWMIGCRLVQTPCVKPASKAFGAVDQE